MNLYTISELADKCGYARTTVRDWYSHFSAYIPSKSIDDGNAYFNEDSIDFIHYIKRLRDIQLKKEEIINFLDENPKPIPYNEINKLIQNRFTLNLPTPRDLNIPYLYVLKDGQIHHVSIINERLTDFFSMSVEQKNINLNNGDSKFKIRARYARRELQVAGLIEQLESNSYRITELGQLVLKQFPKVASITQINEFIKNIDNFKHDISTDSFLDNEDSNDTNTPNEIMDEQFKRINKLLSLEILKKVKSVTPKHFESIVLDLLLAMGYGGFIGSGQTTDYGNDDGVDAIIKEDKLGLDVIYVQAKRWNNPVGRPDIQAFTGSLEGKNARKGVFITTSKFTKEAKEFINRIQKKIVLIDGEQLGSYMLEFNVGVSQERKYIVKKIDSDYFEFEE
ncbi:restriction endonuclease [Alkalihalobacillus trypoxylicola]|uniref:Restriction endonuclease n=1 Tax=Alkalihalobacillus trypoxylicola TaxID=519424 RepID=A0A162EC34_9BACI|nr:restriction endonuclease [Alkalihalobacillus trypoxylicola]KYG32256.1 hypothetical protein AZF04_05685 [Alkalihalobacillus trypoxylicola]